MISGVLGSLYNSHGVPVVIYGTMAPWHIKDFRSTIQAHFLITAIFVVIGQASGGIWTSQTVSLFLLSIPCLIISVVVGKYLINHTTYHNFEKWIYLFIIILGFTIVNMKSKVESISMFRNVIRPLIYLRLFRIDINTFI